MQDQKTGDDSRLTLHLFTAVEQDDRHAAA